MNSFFRELKARRVYRVAIGYAVAAWLIIQVLSTVLPAFRVPLWVLRVVIASLALGFPLALVLGWAFDLTPAGITRAPDETGTAGQNPRNVWLLALAGLLIGALTVAGYWAWHPWRNLALQNSFGTSSSRMIEEKSIAVLPLENLSEEKENAYFADGIQDDLLSNLAKIKALRVISRSSVMGYREVAKRNLREIGEELGVATVLEGSVRRAQNRVLVTVALIDTRTGQEIWAERYDRTLEDSLTLQGKLATEIAAALRATISPEEKVRVETKPTENADAYVLYLRAREYHTRPTHLLQDYQTAIRLYGEAIALDPGFALAHARLSAALAFIYLNYQSTPEIKERARTEAEEALRLRPDSGEGTLARALCYYWTDKDYPAALRELGVAARLRPGDAEIDLYSGAIRRRQGRWPEALASMRQALVGDPRSVLIAREIMVTDCSLRDWATAARDGERALNLAPDLPSLRVEKDWIDVWAKGNLDPLRKGLATVPPGVDPDGGITISRWDTALLARDFASADNLLGSAPESVTTVFGPVLPKSYLLGCVALARGDQARAYELFESAREPLETEARNYPLDPFRQAQLGLLYAYLGRKEDALRLGRRAVEILPESKDALYGACVSGWLALIYTRAGETDQALALIERLLKTPGPLFAATEGSVTQAELRLRWQWDPLRQDPRFQKILASPEPRTVSSRIAPALTTLRRVGRAGVLTANTN